MNTDLDISVPSCSHTSPTALGSKIEKIITNDFFNVNVFFILSTFLTGFFLPFYPIMIFN